MSSITLFLLALGLAMDAFSVSVSNTMCYTGLRRGTMLFTSAMFGLFQGLMPLVGYWAGQAFSQAVNQFDHWIAFVLLAFIGGKMLWDALHEDSSDDTNPKEAPTLTVRMILVQAVATSIDALAVGVSLAALSVNITLAAAFIAVVTFACCVGGHLLGRRMGHLLGKWAQVAGGTVLIAIGLKILIEHLFF